VQERMTFFEIPKSFLLRNKIRIPTEPGTNRKQGSSNDLMQAKSNSLFAGCVSGFGGQNFCAF
jgi:hypothetical protein